MEEESTEVRIHKNRNFSMCTYCAWYHMTALLAEISCYQINFEYWDHVERKVKRKRKGKLTKKWRNLWMKVHTNTQKLDTFWGSHTFTLFWSRKASVNAEIFQVSMCLCVLSSWDFFIFWWVFPFLSYLSSYNYE